MAYLRYAAGMQGVDINVPVTCSVFEPDPMTSCNVVQRAVCRGGVVVAAARFAQTKFVVRLASRLEHTPFSGQI